MPAVDGKAIREKRQRLGLKIGQFAAASGVATQTVANVESNGQAVSIEVVYRFARVLGTDAMDLLVSEPAA